MAGIGGEDVMLTLSFIRLWIAVKRLKLAQWRARHG